MRYDRIMFAIVVAVMACCNFAVYAQSGGIQPPPCCKKEDPPPPFLPAGNVIAPTTVETDSMPVVTISDSTLRAQGMTRSQFLDQLAETFLARSAGSVSLIIPIIIQSTDADGTVTYQAVFFNFEKGEVAEAIIEGLNVFYLTDGTTMIAINFIPDVYMHYPQSQYPNRRCEISKSDAIYSDRFNADRCNGLNLRNSRILMV